MKETEEPSASYIAAIAGVADSWRGLREVKAWAARETGGGRRLLDEPLFQARLSEIAFEMPLSGGVLPLMEIKSWKFLRYDGSSGIFLMVCETILLFLVFFFTAKLIFGVCFVRVFPNSPFSCSAEDRRMG